MTRTWGLSSSGTDLDWAALINYIYWVYSSTLKLVGKKVYCTEQEEQEEKHFSASFCRDHVRIKNEFHRWCKDYGFTDLHRAALKIILEGGSAFQPTPKKMTAVKVSAAERKEANKTCKLVPTTPRRQIEGHRCQSSLVSSTQGLDTAATVSSYFPECFVLPSCSNQTP